MPKKHQRFDSAIPFLWPGLTLLLGWMARATGPPRNSEKKSGLIPVRRVTNRRAVRGKASKRKDQPRRHDGYKHADGDVGRQAWPRRPGCPSQSHDCNWLGAGKISAATRKIPGASAARMPAWV